MYFGRDADTGVAVGGILVDHPEKLSIVPSAAIISSPHRFLAI